MAPIDGLFSSPEKETPAFGRTQAGDDQTQGAMDMDLESGRSRGAQRYSVDAKSLLQTRVLALCPS